MNKKEVIERLCFLVSVVGREKYHSEIEHDCFCTEMLAPFFLSVHPEILAFIGNAIDEKLKREQAV